MVKRYRIDVEMSLRRAEAESARFGSVLAKAEANAARAFDKTEAAAARSAKRQADVQAREAERATAARQRAAEKAQAAAERAALDAVRRADRLAAVEERRMARLESARERAAAREVAIEARKHKQLMTDAEVALAVQNKAVENANKRRVRAALDAAGVEGKTWSAAIRDATGFTATMTKVGASAMAIDVVGRAVGSLAKGFADAQQKSKEFFDELIDTASDLRELATINEKGAPDAALVRQHIELRRYTGMTRSEATGFATELGNALGVIGEDRLSQAERSNLVLEGGKFAARGGGGAEAIKSRATMLAMIANYLPKGGTAKQNVAMADAIDVILGKGSASQQVMTEQYRDVLTALTSNDPESRGLLADPRQAASLVAIASGFDPTAPAHATMMAARQARKFTNFRKMRGMTASATETLTKAGIKETDDPVTSMTKMFEFAQKNMGKDEAFDAFLARRGFRESESNRNLMKFYERWKAGDFGRVMAMASAPVDPAAPDRKFAAFAAEPLTAALILRQRAQTAKLQVALERQPLESAKLESEEAVTRRDAAWGTAARRAMQSMYALGQKPGRQVEIEEETIRRLQRMPGGDRTSMPWGYMATQMADPFRLGYGFSLGSILGANDQYIEELKRNTDAMIENNRLMHGQASPQAGVKGQSPMPLTPAPRGNPGVL